jgi:D-alanyl-D-alanine carboxypeptidase/D-alanyl-D-alanine-endopeptidase (penicillin-binding protein 4)
LKPKGFFYVIFFEDKIYDFCKYFMAHNNKLLNALSSTKPIFSILLIFFELLIPAQIATSQNLPIAIAQNSSPDIDQVTNKICPVDLPQKIDSLMTAPELQKAHWGILIKTLKKQTTLYDRDGNQFFIPASNVKLLTTAAALVKLGENYQIKTPIYYQGNNAKLSRLSLIGKGDPSLIIEQLKTVANTLKSQGIKQVEKLILEDNILPQNYLNLTWEWEDIHFYFAPAINQLMLNKNAVELTLSPQRIGQPLKVVWSDAIAGKQWQVINQTRTVAGNPSQGVSIKGILGKSVLILEGELGLQSEPKVATIAILDPARYFAESFQQVLTEVGIQVDQLEIVNNPSFNPQDKLLLEISSPTIPELITETNQESNNLYAEALLNLIKEKPDSLDSLKNILQSLGLDPNGYLLKDGSGLSRQNLVSPKTFVQLLTAMAQSPNAESYQKSLAIAAEKGTLSNRFQDTAVAGKLQAKTGTLSGSSTLSGYLDNPNFETLVFSILVNNSEQSSPVLRKAIDSIIILLSQLKKC